MGFYLARQWMLLSNLFMTFFAGQLGLVRLAGCGWGWGCGCGSDGFVQQFLQRNEIVAKAQHNTTQQSKSKSSCKFHIHQMRHSSFLVFCRLVAWFFGLSWGFSSATFSIEKQTGFRLKCFTTSCSCCWFCHCILIKCILMRHHRRPPMRLLYIINYTNAF